MVLAIVAYLSLRLRNQYAKYAKIPPTIIGAMMLTKINSMVFHLLPGKCSPGSYGDYIIITIKFYMRSKQMSNTVYFLFHKRKQYVVFEYKKRSMRYAPIFIIVNKYHL